jgi:hypothetical protein
VTSSWTPAAADPELVRRVLAESGVDQRLPAPGVSAYAQALVEALWRRLAELLRPLRPRLLPHMEWLALALMAGAIVFLGLLLARALKRRRAAAREAPTSRPAEQQPTPQAGRDREGWRRAFEERCGRGEVAGALEAIWWFLATSIAPRDVDPAWTSRELLEESSRQDLTPLARGLDRMIYGSLRPAVAELRLFFGRLREALS